MYRIFFIIFTILLLLQTSLIAQTSAPKYSNEFLNIGVGARALGMGGTHTAIVNDVTSGYWNPAALTDIDNQYELSLMHAEYFAGIAKYDYGGFSTKIDSASTLGLTLLRFAVDDIPDTRFLYDANGRINYNNIRFFSAADYAFLFSYARKVNFLKGLSLGANIKIVHRNVGNFANAWGFGLDAAAKLHIKQWQFGLMLMDITGTFNAWSHNSELVIDVYTQTGNLIPENSIEVTLPKAILGGGRSFRFFNERVGLLTAADLRFTFDGKRNVLLKSDAFSIDPSLGIEIDYQKVAFLRLGAGNAQEVKDFDGRTHYTFQPDFGVGVKIKRISIDYALTDIGDRAESLYSHIFSLKIGFDSKQYTVNSY